MKFCKNVLGIAMKVITQRLFHGIFSSTGSQCGVFFGLFWCILFCLLKSVQYFYEKFCTDILNITLTVAEWKKIYYIISLEIFLQPLGCFLGMFRPILGMFLNALINSIFSYKNMGHSLLETFLGCFWWILDYVPQVSGIT